jgi:DNA-binding PadR family transcriptional regulator
MTAETQKVLLLMLQEPSRSYYGLEIIRDAGLKGGTLYPILARLEDAEWVTSEWESMDPAAEGRRPRRYYTLTPEGVRQAAQVQDKLMSMLKLDKARVAPSLGSTVL